MKKLLLTIAAISFLLVACNNNDDDDVADSVELEQAITDAQVELVSEIATTLNVNKDELELTITSHKEKGTPPVAIVSVIILTTLEISEETVENVVEQIQHRIEEIDGIGMYEDNIMITDIEGNAFH